MKDFSNIMETKIIGHEKQRNYLKRTIYNDKINHSYLFEGPEGIGKKKIAIEFAKEILCTGLDGPCGECSSCIKIETNNHPDFNLIEPDKGIIRKSQIDEVVEGAWTAPFESSKKIYVINDSHLMNVESMNGLLKTLEEPPKFMVMILISHDSKKLLPTIISRCQRMTFNPIIESKIVKYLLETKNLDKKRAEFIGSLSLGSLMLAEYILEDENFLINRDKLIKLIGELKMGNRIMAYMGHEMLKEDEDNLNLLLDFMIYWFRDLAIYKETRDNKIIINKDKEKEISEQSLNMSFSEINDIIENIGMTKKNIRANVNLDLSLEMMFLNI